MAFLNDDIPADLINCGFTNHSPVNGRIIPSLSCIVNVIVMTIIQKLPLTGYNLFETICHFNIWLQLCLYYLQHIVSCTLDKRKQEPNLRVTRMVFRCSAVPYSSVSLTCKKIIRDVIKQ